MRSEKEIREAHEEIKQELNRHGKDCKCSLCEFNEACLWTLEWVLGEE